MFDNREKKMSSIKQYLARRIDQHRNEYSIFKKIIESVKFLISDISKIYYRVNSKIIQKALNLIKRR